MKIELSNQQVNNLLIFLERVELKGTKEAIALADLCSAISSVISSVEDIEDNAIPESE